MLAAGCGIALALAWGWQVSTEQLTAISGIGYAIAYLCGGFLTSVEVWTALRQRRLEIDLLMLVAAAGAAVLGQFAEGALLLFLFSLAHALEHFAMGRARRAIESLADLAPETAHVRRQGQVSQVPVADLVIGDCVIVKPGERIPADGLVSSGSSSVNQAAITGESIPVDKHAVADWETLSLSSDWERVDATARVFAGTINQSGGLEIRVTRLAGESTLARVVTMVNQAKSKRSPTQRFTQQFERFFVPAVLGLVFVLMFAFLVVQETFSQSFYRAMAVLVGASPCALAISTPSAVLSGVARAARGGVLIKGGGPLEMLGAVQVIAFDKTGTLTTGKPKLTDVVPFTPFTAHDLLATAVAIEQLSDHPLAKAIVTNGRQRLGQDFPIEEFTHGQNVVGQGFLALAIRADFSNPNANRSLPTHSSHTCPDPELETVFIGKSSALIAQSHAAPAPKSLGCDELDHTFDFNFTPISPAQRQQIDELESQGRTTMVLRRGADWIGVLGVMDSPRADAAGVIQQLREMSVQRLVMISGDNHIVAEAIGRQVGVDQAWGDLLPDDKVNLIRQLQASGIVAMVGDGVNDAPAMAQSSVGIAMGAAGSDMALETADVALMADDLKNLPFAVRLSRATRRVITQNLWISLGMIAILIPSAITGLPMAWAVALHEGSTVVVVLNALRLLAHKK